MQTNELGRTGIKVSDMCLGTMTFGTQTSMDEGCRQIDMALDHGINFLDTAEMYPTNPLSKETQGDTERVIGEWVKRSGRRSEMVSATKVSGSGYKNVRDGAAMGPETIGVALEASLASLNTDYVDLYQLHWPNRGSYMFRQNWTYDPTGQDRAEVLEHMEAVLEALAGHIKAGRIRAVGLSNESAWGSAQWLRLAEDKGLPRMATIQNEYSLLCRMFDTDMAELSHHEDLGLLAFSPLAAGLLSGKYQGGAKPEGSRKTFVDDLGGRFTPNAVEAVARYLEIAERHGLNPIHMALAWCRTRPFMTSAIFGATTEAQLVEVLQGLDLELSAEVMAEITEVYRDFPMPY